MDISCPVQLPCDLPTWEALTGLLDRVKATITAGDNGINLSTAGQPTPVPGEVGGQRACMDQLIGPPPPPDSWDQLTELLKEIVHLVHNEPSAEDDRQERVFLYNS